MECNLLLQHNERRVLGKRLAKARVERYVVMVQIYSLGHSGLRKFEAPSINAMWRSGRRYSWLRYLFLVRRSAGSTRWKT